MKIKVLLRYISVIVLVGFLTQTSSFAIDLSCQKLSPPSRFDYEELLAHSLTVAAICKYVELDGNLDNASYLDNVLARLDAITNLNITLLQYEIIIEIPDEGLAIRYFDPRNANVVTPFNNVARLRTKVINDRLCRQIIHRVKAIGSGRDGWREIHHLTSGKKRSFFRAIGGVVKNKWRWVIKPFLQGRIGNIMVSRTLSDYDKMIRPASPRSVFADQPILRNGLSGLLEDYVTRNSGDNRETNYLDACGGMGCVATEASIAYAERGLRSFVVDLEEWQVARLPSHEIERVRKYEKERGIRGDLLSRQFTFIQSDVETVSLPEKMDIITNWAGLNYTDNPLGAIVNLYNQLKKGGILVAGYDVPVKHKECLNAYYDFLRTLEALGAAVTCKTSHYKSGGDEGYFIGISIIRNSERDLRLNLVPHKPIRYQTAVRKMNLFMKVVYYHAEKGIPPISYTDRPLAKGAFAMPSATSAALNRFIDKQQVFFSDLFSVQKPIILRVPVEAIETSEKECIQGFLETFQRSPNAYLELYYMSGVDGVTKNIYQKYGLKKKILPKGLKRTRENTVTLFPVLKGEKVTQLTIRSRLGTLEIKPEDTILSPIGLQNDPAGLMRATIVGLRMMNLVREIKQFPNRLKDPRECERLKDRIQADILESYKNICDPSMNFDLNREDIINLVTGDINDIIPVLNKLIKLLPITPIDAEELRQIYEHARKVLIAA